MILRTYLEAVAAGASAGVQHFNAVEVGLSRYTVNFFHTLVNFSLDGVDIGSRVRAVLRLNGQITDTLQVVVDFTQCAFCRLCQRDTVVGVTCSNGQAVDVRGETVSDRLTSSVVFCTVDAQTGGQTLNRGAQRRLRFAQVVLSHQRQSVSINHCHGKYPLIDYEFRLAARGFIAFIKVIDRAFTNFRSFDVFFLLYFTLILNEKSADMRRFLSVITAINAEGTAWSAEPGWPEPVRKSQPAAGSARGTCWTLRSRSRNPEYGCGQRTGCSRCCSGW